jgi:hypothetical protein
VAVDYALEAKASEIIERICYAVAAETPTLAPTVLFREHDDTTTGLDNITEPDRLRRFEVVTDGPDEESDGATDYDENVGYSLIFKLRIGYPVGSHEEIAGTFFKVAHLIAHDFEQLDPIVRAAGTYNTLDGLPAIEKVLTTRLKGVRGSKLVKETVYQIDFLRAR